MANIRALFRKWGGMPGRLIDNGDGTFSELVSTQPSGGSTAVTGPLTNVQLRAVDVQVAAFDGQIETLGSQSDPEATGSGGVVALLKRLRTLLAGGLPAALVGGRLDVNVGNTPTVVANVGTGTQPVSAVALPLPAGAATAAGQALWPNLPGLTGHVYVAQVAPLANAVGADTGPLAAGEYRIEYDVSFADGAAIAKEAQVAHRNAANAADLFVDAVVAPGQKAGVWSRITVAGNERVVVRNGTVAGAALSTLKGHIRTYKLA